MNIDMTRPGQGSDLTAPTVPGVNYDKLTADAEDESVLSKEQLDKLMPLPKVNLVATQGANDEKDLYEACGTKNGRKVPPAPAPRRF